MFALAQIFFDFTNTGAIDVRTKISTFVTNSYDGVGSPASSNEGLSNRLRFGLEVIFLLFTILNIFAEIHEIRDVKEQTGSFKDYYSSGTSTSLPCAALSHLLLAYLLLCEPAWNLLDWVSVLGLLAIFVFQFHHYGENLRDFKPRARYEVSSTY
jgi:hypothetical protein